MTNSNVSAELTEQDLNDIVAFNRQLLDCHQRPQLNALIREQLMPLLQARACLYFFTEPSLSKVQITEAINVPEETLALLPHMFVSDPMTQKFLSGHRSVLAYDVDLDRGLSRKAIDQFFVDNPQFESQRSVYVDSVSSGMAAINLPNANVGLVVHRWHTADIPYTPRDVRMLELLWPSIAQTIRSIFLSEELSRYRSFAESLADIASPIALINEQGILVYQNSAYEGLFPDCAVNSWLPDELMAMVRGEMARFGEETFKAEPVKTPFLHSGQSAYRVSLANVEVENGDERIWMLRLDLTADAYSILIQHLQKSGLSPKEVEVCLLMRDGIAPRKAAERLCVSYYTVRSHLRNIYLKLGINTQVQLITYLNRNGLSELSPAI
jgi:DNA-binding CsgD family transcriptional regulator